MKVSPHVSSSRPCRRRAVAIAALACATLPALAQDHPFARYPPPPSQLANGVYNGVDLERRSGCTSSQNNGTRGTYAQFTVATDPTGYFAIDQAGITGLTCAYSGHYSVTNGAMGIDGTYNCSDGKQGSFHATRVDASGVSLTIEMHVQLTASETCSIDAVLGMSRFYP